MSKSIIVNNIEELLNSFNELTSEYDNLETACEKITKCFTQIREANMQGLAATKLLEICDEWEKINTERLEQIKILGEKLNKSYNGYNEVSAIIKKEVDNYGV